MTHPPLGASEPSGPGPAVVDPRLVPPHLRPALPVEDRDYFAFWRAPRYRWWKSLLALAMGGLLAATVMIALPLVGLLVDGADLGELASTGAIEVGPGLFLGNNIALALCVPIALLVQWACVQQPPGWLSSVEGRLRWRWLAVVALTILPLWILLVGGQLLIEPPTDARWRDYSAVMIVGILLTTPLQAAGEEYLVRGLLGRIVASWFSAPALGFAASTAMTAWVFMLLHGAGDPWLNAFYVLFGVACSWLTWRTGGLEAAIALHVVNNVLSEALLPFTDFSDLFDREAGVADATMLIQLAAVAAAVAVVEHLARRRRPVRASAPARPFGAAHSASPPFGTPAGEVPQGW